MQNKLCLALHQFVSSSLHGAVCMQGREWEGGACSLGFSWASRVCCSLLTRRLCSSARQLFVSLFRLSPVLAVPDCPNNSPRLSRNRSSKPVEHKSLSSSHPITKGTSKHACAKERKVATKPDPWNPVQSSTQAKTKSANLMLNPSNFRTSLHFRIWVH